MDLLTYHLTTMKQATEGLRQTLLELEALLIKDETLTPTALVEIRLLLGIITKVERQLRECAETLRGRADNDTVATS